jgi:hypothetical protein
VRHHMPAMADAKKAHVADVHTSILVAPASTTHVMRKTTPPTAKSTLVSDFFAGGCCGVTREVRPRGWPGSGGGSSTFSAGISGVYCEGFDGDQVELEESETGGCFAAFGRCTASPASRQTRT